MPPKKDKLSKVDLRELRRKKGIRLEGPVPSSKWPDEHKHHFKTIRAIEEIRYEKYQANRDIPKGRRRDFKERVHYLRKKAYDMLDEIKINESTWRELEPCVFKRFDEDVLCGNCNNELREVDFEADFLHEENQLKLGAKRRLRQICECKNRRGIAKAENSDDEDQALFEFAKEESIIHGADDDDLRNLSISMRPDRVIGLRAPSRIPHNDTLFPVTGRRIILPFLVVEAKKEDSAGGFRAIQYQTVFPVRRFLEAQAAVAGQIRSDESCLVWFFAYQGEQWRLHVGTRSRDKVRIYDLWQGTIQSQDGALQLLLIVDYISSWARDIYRPTIRQLLLNSSGNSRDFSPASTDRFRHSISLSCATSPAPMTLDQDAMDLDETVSFIGNSGSLLQHNEAECAQWSDLSTIQDASSHDFLRWGVGHQRSPSWADIQSIRQSNIVQLEYQLYFSTYSHHYQEENNVEGQLDGYSSCGAFPTWSFGIPLNGLQELASLWMVDFVPSPAMSTEKNLQVSFLFQTHCNRKTWQIKRVLTFIVWNNDVSRPAGSASSISGPTDMVGDRELLTIEGLKNAILDSRQIQGRDSVWYALREVSMALVPQPNHQWPTWKLAEHVIIPDTWSEKNLQTADDAHFEDGSIRCDLRDGGLWLVDAGLSRRRQLGSTLPELEKDARSGNSMLAIRSPSWPEICPKFCLFVLPNDIDDTTGTLHKLLEEAVSLKNYYAEGDYKWSRADWQALWKWRKTLEQGVDI